MDQEGLLTNEDVERASQYDDYYGKKGTVATAEIHIRLSFLRKVYSLLTIQLGMTVVISAIFMFVPIVQFYIRNSDWMVMVAFIATLGFLIALHFKSRHHPVNLILLAGFTLTQSFMIGSIVGFYDQLSVLKAFVITFVVVVGLSLYAFQTRKDYTTMGSGLFAGLMVLIVGGFLQMFIGGSGLEFILSVGGALLFSLFIIYDTQMLLSKVSPEEYIFATISLYLDIINLFLYILRIFGDRRQ